MKHNIRIFDNGGQTIDRWTIVFLDRKNGIYHESYSFSHTPSSPTGFGQWGESLLDEWDNKHLGKEKKWDEVPEKLKEFLVDNVF